MILASYQLLVDVDTIFYRYGGRDSGRANALAAVQGLNPRSQSVMGPHPALSRENSGGQTRSYSMVHTNNTPYPEVPLNGADKASIDEVEKWTKPLLDEFLNLVNYEDTVKEVAEKFSSNTISMFVSTVFNQVNTLF